MPIYKSLLTYGGIAGGLLGMNAMRQNLQSNLQLNWRKAMNEQYTEKWMKDRAYLRLQTSENPLDNPDQRLFEDINNMTTDVINLGCGFINAMVTFPAFALVLWNLSGTLNLNLGSHHLAIPGVLMFGAIAYAAAGTWAARAVGKPLVGLHYNQQKLETSLRNGTGHIRNNAESIALYSGEQAEKRALGVRINRIAENSGRINIKETHLAIMRDLHGRVGYVMPYMLMLPNVFAGGAKWGDLAQGAHAMGQVQSSLSWLFYSYSAIARIQAMVGRISSFDRAVVDSRKTEISRYPDRTHGVQLELGL
jgi:putative ATP-binding cassette transporter